MRTTTVSEAGRALGRREEMAVRGKVGYRHAADSLGAGGWGAERHDGWEMWEP